jgi:hypothetical protein
MPWNEDLAALMRADLSAEGVTEQKMFGGLAFLRGGHMVCGIHKGGAMFRVGKPNEAAALAVAGASPMTMNGRPMPGMIDLADEAVRDGARRRKVMEIALGFVRALPPKA